MLEKAEEIHIRSIGVKDIWRNPFNPFQKAFQQGKSRSVMTLIIYWTEDLQRQIIGC
jgi:hypothetical protein